MRIGFSELRTSFSKLRIDHSYFWESAFSLLGIDHEYIRSRVHAHTRGSRVWASHAMAGWLALRLSLTICPRLSLTIDLERAAAAENFLPEQGSHLRSETNAPSEALTCDLTAHDQERDTLPVGMPRIASACNVGRVVSRACENPRGRESRYRFY